MVQVGIDVGSANTAMVLFDQNQILTYLIASPEETDLKPRDLLEQALNTAGIGRDKIGAIVATGRGRSSIDFTDRQSSEVACQARGATWLFPSVRSIINLGAETSRVLELGEDGRVKSFAANDKCAAGSGLFLDSIAHLMAIPVAEIGNLALKAEKREEVSSRCAVFAESEIISHIHRGVSKENILAGVHQALTDRILDLCSRITLHPEVLITGGVAKNPAIITELRAKIGLTTRIPKEPQILGALGAALLGY